MQKGTELWLHVTSELEPFKIRSGRRLVRLTSIGPKWAAIEEVATNKRARLMRSTFETLVTEEVTMTQKATIKKNTKKAAAKKSAAKMEYDAEKAQADAENKKTKKTRTKLQAFDVEFEKGAIFENATAFVRLLATLDADFSTTKTLLKKHKLSLKESTIRSHRSKYAIKRCGLPIVPATDKKTIVAEIKKAA